MTFEEFFQKKKIDISALGKERPQLLEEFRSHFEAMGEKSFDHTKKYWFNRLRKSYPLREEPSKPKVPAAPAAAVKSSEGKIPAQGGEGPKPSLGFKPRFKAGKTGNPAPAPAGKTEAPEEKKKTQPASREETEGEKTETTEKKRTDPEKQKTEPASREETEKEGAETQKKGTDPEKQESAQENQKQEQKREQEKEQEKPAGKPAYKPRLRAGTTPSQKK